MSKRACNSGCTHISHVWSPSSRYVVKIHSRSELATGKRKSEVAKDSGSRKQHAVGDQSEVIAPKRASMAQLSSADDAPMADASTTAPPLPPTVVLDLSDEAAEAAAAGEQVVKDLSDRVKEFFSPKAAVSGEAPMAAGQGSLDA